MSENRAEGKEKKLSISTAMILLSRLDLILRKSSGN